MVSVLTMQLFKTVKGSVSFMTVMGTVNYLKLKMMSSNESPYTNPHAVETSLNE